MDGEFWNVYGHRACESGVASDLPPHSKALARAAKTRLAARGPRFTLIHIKRMAVRLC
jgi:hypothetical protein